MPAMNLALGPRGRKAAVQKAKNRHTSPLATEHRKAGDQTPEAKLAARRLARTRGEYGTEDSELQHKFNNAARGPLNQGGGGSDKGPGVKDQFKPERPDRGKGRRSR